MVLPIIISTILGLCIGWERHVNGKIAGIRTYATMALAVSLFATLSLHIFEPEHRVYIALAVIIGAALLASRISVVEQDGIPEFTNMVSLWATAAVALTISYGYYIVGSTVAFLLITIYIIKDIVEPKNKK